MHHYPFHSGDYLRDTAHLSDREDLLYRRMIDLYYTTEAPLPDNIEAIARRIRARQPDDAAVIQLLLTEFFQFDDGVWSQHRCDKEILSYQERAGRARENGEKGGRPKGAKKKPSGNPAGTQEKPSGFSLGFQEEPSVNPDRTQAKANQEPVTKNQEPVTKNQVFSEKTKKLLSGKPDVSAPDPGVDPDAPAPDPEPDAGPDAAPTSEAKVEGDLIEYLNQRAGKAFRPVHANIRLVRGRLRDGFTPDDVRAVIDAKVAEWESDPKMAAYLRPDTLFGATKFAQYHGALGHGAPGSKRGAGTTWWARAGFGSEWAAQNAGCTPATASEFSDGIRNPQGGVKSGRGDVAEGSEVLALVQASLIDPEPVNRVGEIGEEWA